MANWWQGGGESGGPSEADLRAAGFQYVGGGEGGSWQAPQGWARDPSATMGYAPAPLEPPKVQWRPTAEQLQSLAGQAPASVPKYVETGEGGYTAYDYYDPASQAKLLLAQPEKVTPEYIAQNFPGFGRLPASTLQAMANDWRNAYAQLMKINAPDTLPEGYSQAVNRVVDGKPFISFGGPTEIFEEAAPYVQYVPEYGLVVPQQGIQPYREKFGLMELAPIVMGGFALGPLATALGGGTLGAAAAGALTGGFNSAVAGGNVLKGALTGGVTGGLGAAATPIVGGALQTAGITGLAADALTKAAVSAGTAAMRGGNPLQAALSAATGSIAGGAIGGMDILKSLDPAVADAITAAASGAARAVVSGADPVQSALTSIADAGLKAAMRGGTSALAPAQQSTAPAALDFEYSDIPYRDVINPDALSATPTEKWIDQGFLVNEATPSIESLLAELSQQEEDQAGMQSSILGYDPRIVAAMQASSADQATLASLLASTGIAMPGKTAGGGAGTQRAAPATPSVGVQQIGGMDAGSLLALLGLSQQQKVEPPRVPTVGEIKPFDISSNLLEGIYNQSKPGLYGSNDELLRMTGGK